jgi:hypothetical protein
LPESPELPKLPELERYARNFGNYPILAMKTMSAPKENARIAVEMLVSSRLWQNVP